MYEKVNHMAHGVVYADRLCSAAGGNGANGGAEHGVQ